VSGRMIRSSFQSSFLSAAGSTGPTSRLEVRSASSAKADWFFLWISVMVILLARIDAACCLFTRYWEQESKTKTRRGGQRMTQFRRRLAQIYSHSTRFRGQGGSPAEKTRGKAKYRHTGPKKSPAPAGIAEIARLGFESESRA
jgi:hypothetical protein